MSKSSEEARQYQVEWAKRCGTIEDDEMRHQFECMNELFMSIEHETYIDTTQQPQEN